MFQNIPTVSSQVLTYLKKKKGKWISVGELEDIVHHHNGSSTSRICRMMAEENIIKREYIKKVPKLRALVHYKL